MSREEKAPDDAELKLQQDLLDHKSSLSAVDGSADVPEAELVEQNVVSPADSLTETYQSDLATAILVESLIPTDSRDSNALLAGTGAPEGQVNPGNMLNSRLQTTPPMPSEMDNVAAVGGAVAALVLGAWSLLGAFVTPWSIINAVLGIVLGIWGISSRRRRLAWIGIMLCLASAIFCLVQYSGIINQAITPIPDENL